LPLEQHHKIGIKNIEKIPQKLAKLTQGSIKTNNFYKKIIYKKKNKTPPYSNNFFSNL
jgi:hypothetical protein